MRINRINKRYTIKPSKDILGLIGVPGEFKCIKKYLFGLIKRTVHYSDYTYNKHGSEITIDELQKVIDNGDYFFSLLEIHEKTKEVWFKPFVAFFNGEMDEIKSFKSNYELNKWLKENSDKFENIEEFSNFIS